MKKITKGVIPVIIAASLLYPNRVSAGYPVLDISNLYEAITSNIQMMQNWAQEKMLAMAEMDLQSMLSSLGIDAQNNAITNLIVREGKKDQTIQNIEMTMHSVPDMDACDTLTAQIIEQKSKEDNEKKSQESSNNQREKHNTFGETRQEWEDAQTKIIEDTFEVCKGVADGEGLNNTMCAQGSLLFGGLGGKSLKAEESETAKTVIDLLSGITADYKQSNSVTNDTPQYKDVALKEIRKEAFRDIARTSLHEVNMQFSTNGQLSSPFESLQKFSDVRYGDDQWLMDIQNVDPDNKNAVYISEITRKIAVMNAFMVHLELIKYKQQLRMEAMQAAMLSLEVEPL